MIQFVRMHYLVKTSNRIYFTCIKEKHNKEKKGIFASAHFRFIFSCRLNKTVNNKYTFNYRKTSIFFSIPLFMLLLLSLYISCV